jgi:predicted PurR-regulated permease PerM
MSPPKDKKIIWQRLTEGAPLAVLIAVVLLILYRLLPVLELFSIAALVALVFRTTLEWYEKLFRIRLVAILMLLATAIAFGLILGLVIIPSLIQEIEILAQALPNYFNSLIALFQQLHERIGLFPDLSQSLEQLKNVLNRLLSFVPLIVSSTFDLSLKIIATIILALYIAHDPDSLIGGCLRLIPRQEHQRSRRLLQVIKIRLQGWIFGTGLAVLIIGTGATIGLWILKVPLFFSFGAIAGILEIIPYFGSIVGALLPAMVALTISPFQAMLVLLLFLLLNQLDVHLVQPLVMAERVNLHPIAVILAFLSLGKLLGLIGIVLAVPIAAIVATLVDEFTSKPSA